MFNHNYLIQKVKSYNYKSTPPALPFHLSTADIRILVCGARSGKTRATLGGDLVRDAITQPGYWQSDIDNDEPYTILVCEPTFKMVKLIAWKNVIRALPKGRIIDVNTTDRIIQFQGVYGVTQIIFASYEQGSEKIEGLSIYRAYLDECFQCDEPFYQEVHTRLADRNGKLVMSGTPKHVPYIRKLIDSADGKNVAFFTWTTAQNPYFPKDRLEYLRRMLPVKIFNRNFLASLDEFQGQIWEDFKKSVHVQEFEVDLTRYRYVLAGQDWGYDHAGVLVVFGITFDDEVDIIDVVSERHRNVISDRIGDRTWATINLEMCEKYGIQQVWGGPDRPENIASLRICGVPISKAKNPVVPGIDFVASLLKVDENGHTRFRIRKCEATEPLVNGITGYRWAEGKPKEEPIKEADDECDSMRYGLYSAFKLRYFLRRYIDAQGDGEKYQEDEVA